MNTIFDLSVMELANYAQDVIGEWDGDEPGKKEERASVADEIIHNLARINALYKELEDE